MIRGRRRAWLAVIGGIAGLWGGLASPAAGEVGAPVATVQALAADAEFLEYAPPPVSPGVVCLIDSGVDPNPDTTPILAGSYAMEPGTDTTDELSKLNPPIEPGNHPDGHGTYMAMIMAAPVNGWGMVGIAPTSVKVFNVKALAAGQSTFSFSDYANAIVHCVDGLPGSSAASVVNLSLGSDQPPTPAESARMLNAVEQAQHFGLNVVGSAGNDGAGIEYPAATSGVFAVGAADANPANLGVFCPSSDRGPALGLLAPGCGSQSETGGGGDGIDVAFSDDGTPAWASGTSDAAAVVSGILASMRAYAPGLTPDQAEDCLTSTAAHGGNVDAAAAFRACGLGTLVSEGLAAYQAAISATVPPATTPSSQPTAGAQPVPLAPPETTAASDVAPALKAASSSAGEAGRPRVLSVRAEGRRLVITVADVPRGAKLRVDVARKFGGERYRTVASLTTTRPAASLPVGRWDRIAVMFLEPDRRSPVTYVTRDSR